MSLGFSTWEFFSRTSSKKPGPQNSRSDFDIEVLCTLLYLEIEGYTIPRYPGLGVHVNGSRASCQIACDISMGKHRARLPPARHFIASTRQSEVSLVVISPDASPSKYFAIAARSGGKEPRRAATMAKYIDGDESGEMTTSETSDRIVERRSEVSLVVTSPDASPSRYRRRSGSWLGCH